MGGVDLTLIVMIDRRVGLSLSQGRGYGDEFFSVRPVIGVLLPCADYTALALVVGAVMLKFAILQHSDLSQFLQPSKKLNPVHHPLIQQLDEDNQVFLINVVGIFFVALGDQVLPTS